MLWCRFMAVWLLCLVLPNWSYVIVQVMETWFAYAPVKNNAEDAAKVLLKF